MEIDIQDSSQLCEIQQIFNKHFPYLKLEFFELNATKEQLFSRHNLIKETYKTLSEVRPIHTVGNLSINGHQKVSTLEKHFSEDFGINAQVFRKSGNAWLQTTATDEWTLSEQNKMAEEMQHKLPY